MSGIYKLVNSPRSREPIDEHGIICWSMFGGNSKLPIKTQVGNERQEEAIKETNEDFRDISLPKTTNKSTNTDNTKAVVFTNNNYHENKVFEKIDPKVAVIRKWREKKSKSTYDLARKAIINSIKAKFENTAHSKSCTDIDKVDNRKNVPTIMVTNADVEDTSNSNVNQNEAR